jgi:hypothetical protein
MVQHPAVVVVLQVVVREKIKHLNFQKRIGALVQFLSRSKTLG